MNPLVTEARALCSSRYPHGIWYRSSEERAKTLLPEMAAEIERLESKAQFLTEAYDRNAKVHEALTRDYLAVKSERDRFKARAEAAERDITALARRAIDGFQDAKFITPCRWCAEREQCDLLTNGTNTCFKWRGPQQT